MGQGRLAGNALRDDRAHVQLRPVKRGDGLSRGDLLGQRQRIQRADMHQARGPGQPGRDEQADPGQCGDGYHITTVSRGRHDRLAPGQPWRLAALLLAGAAPRHRAPDPPR